MECREGRPCIGDTYIERKFHENCQKSVLGNNLWSDWLYNKYQYEQRTKTTVYEFMNYSKHDASHSINILDSIERILGRDRVDMLGLGDMWLILNVAYAHDIGMATEYSELQKLWKDSEFLDFLSKIQDSDCKDEYTKAAHHYYYLNTFIRKQKDEDVSLSEEMPQFSWEDYDTWPIEFRTEITLLMSEFLRPRHGERSEKYFKNRGQNGNILLNNRLNILLGRISALHTQDQDEIKSLNLKCNGFSDDNVHPQFIAVLLRVCDLLDLDNNRFDLFSLKHYGKLPHISMLHYKKHQSVEHLLIQPDVIEVTVQSDDFEVCQITLAWFDSLKSEIINMITRWKEIAPSCLKGCRMGLPKLVILHNKKQFSSDFMRSFEFDRKKVLKLFMGNNLYDSNLAFIREYIQNSFDALRIKLWDDLDQEDNRRKYLHDSKIRKKDIKPIDLTKEAYDNYPINIFIRELQDDNGKIDEDRFILEIEDYGIGIDEDGIKSIARIGSGWRERENYTNKIRKMKQWFRPTGGFGIGMQSAFLITDKVEIFTQAKNSSGYQITLSQKDKSNNNIIVECGQHRVMHGTKVELIIEFAKLVADESILRTYGIDWPEWKTADLFDYATRLKIVYHIIKRYVQITFPNSLFPINIWLKAEIPGFCSIQSRRFFVDSQVPSYMEYAEILAKSIAPEKEKSAECSILIAFIEALQKEKITCDRLFLQFDMEDGCLRIWDDRTETFYCLELAKDGNVEVSYSYKNVYVKDNSSKDDSPEKWNETPYIINFLMDVMGSKVEDCLVISRNKFLDDTIIEKFYFDQYTRAYMKAILYRLQNYEKLINYKLWFIMTLICNETFCKEEYEKYKTNLAGDGIYMWELNNPEVPSNWTHTYKLYSELFDRLVDRDIIVAVPENEKSINYSLNEESDAFESFKRKLLIIADQKTLAVLGYYLNVQGEVILKKPDVKGAEDQENDSKKQINMEEAKGSSEQRSMNTLDFPAIKLVNTDDIERKDLSFITSSSYEQKHDVNKASNKKERTYIVIEDEVPIGQEALVVKSLPFIPAEGNKKYIISPYNKKILAKIHQQRYNSIQESGENTSFTVQTLIDIVTADKQFERLCKWVYEYQVETGRFDLSQIQKAYRERLIADFHQEGARAFFDAVE